MGEKKCFLAVLSFLIGAFLLEKTRATVEIGQLKCTDSGVYPDDKLIGLVMQKCQPKLDDPREVLIACITKCMLRQMKALSKKGKMKKSEAEKLFSILPDEYQDMGKAKFKECYKSHASKVKKESKCDSWVPFSSCFVGFAENLCKGNSTEAPA